MPKIPESAAARRAIALHATAVRMGDADAARLHRREALAARAADFRAAADALDTEIAELEAAG